MRVMGARGFLRASFLLDLIGAAPALSCGGAPTPESSPAAGSPAPPAFTLLHASSRQIGNAQGEAVHLRGVNLGGWLVKEGYILHFPGPAYDSPSEIDGALRDLAGPALGTQLLDEYREQWIAEADLAEIAALGFDSVRTAAATPTSSPRCRPIDDGCRRAARGRS